MGVLENPWPTPGSGNYVAQTQAVVSEIDAKLAAIQSGAAQIPLAGIEGALADDRSAGGVAYVLDYDAVADGSTDSRAEIQAAIDTGAGTIVFPATTDRFRVGSALIPQNNQRFISAGFQYVHSGTSAKRAHIGGLSTYNGPIFELDGLTGVTFDGLIISGSGNTAHTDNIGIDAINADYLTIKHCAFNNFAGPGLRWSEGIALFMERCLTTNCALDPAPAAYVGAAEIHGQDGHIAFNEFSSVPAGHTYDTGYIAAMYVKGGNNFILCNVVELSEVGMVLDNVDNKCFENVVIGNRADINLGHGFVVAANLNQFIGNRSYRNSQAATETYDGFSITSNRNLFVGNSVDNLTSDSALRMRDGFRDTSSAADATEANQYGLNRIRGIGGNRYTISDADHLVFDLYARSANADTSGATLGDLETEVNELKALLRAVGVMKA